MRETDEELPGGFRIGDTVRVRPLLSMGAWVGMVGMIVATGATYDFLVRSRMTAAEFDAHELELEPMRGLRVPIQAEAAARARTRPIGPRSPRPRFTVRDGWVLPRTVLDQPIAFRRVR